MEPLGFGIGAVLMYIAGRSGTEQLNNILGPSFKDLGERFVESRKVSQQMDLHIQRVQRVLDIAERRLGNHVERDGRVPDRLAYSLLGESMLVEDEIGAEYFGGLLANVRSTAGNDDRDFRFVTILKNLTVNEIRLHFAIYAAYDRGVTTGKVNPASKEHSQNFRMWITPSDWANLNQPVIPDFPPDISDWSREHQEYSQDLYDSVQTLSRYRLIDQSFYWFKEYGSMVKVSPLGLRLHFAVNSLDGKTINPTFLGDRIDEFGMRASVESMRGSITVDKTSAIAPSQLGFKK